MTMQLFASKGCGSICVEAVLQLVKVDYQRVEVSPWSNPEEAERLGSLNPLKQVPTLLLADGRVLTETLAIMVWLAENHPEAQLLPPAGSIERAEVLRGLLFLDTSIYVPMVMSDFPGRWLDETAAQDNFVARVNTMLVRRWHQFESFSSASPWLSGAHFGLLDIYAAMMARWRPGPVTIVAECPRLAPILRSIEAQPVIAALWAAQFDS